ncbi:H-NS histone family protein [Delftia sp. GW456-R20]|uniref:H-NS histone family protein n=1 Tax=Delftia sp. GW456-R20 TaxID=1827145 RepID=UPI0009ED04A0|nr:H-NS histone family protein [Delftia sp. GW456-R20]
MSTSYKELLAQREALEAQIEAARKQEVSDVVAKVRSLVADYGLTATDIFTSKRPNKATAGEAKFRDPATGKTWTGRGKPPDWIKGKDRSSYAL